MIVDPMCGSGSFITQFLQLSGEVEKYMNLENNNIIPNIDYAPSELQVELKNIRELTSELQVELKNIRELTPEKLLEMVEAKSDIKEETHKLDTQLSESDQFLIKRAYAMALLQSKNHPIEARNISKKKNTKNKNTILFARVWTKLIVYVNCTTEDKILNDGLTQFNCVIVNPPFQTKKHQCVELLLLDDLRLNIDTNCLDKCKCYIPVIKQISDSVNIAATGISKKFEIKRKSNTKNVFRDVFIETYDHTWEALQIYRDRINPSGNISNLTTKLNKKVNSPDKFNKILELLITSREMSKIIVDILENKSGDERDIEVQKLLNRIVAVDNLKNILEIWKDNQNNSSEEFWHKLFEENSFVLGQVFSIPVTILRSNAYVGGQKLNNKGGKYPDYLMIHKQTRNTALIEIKTPETQLLSCEYRSDVYPISREITGAVNQLLTYRDEFLKDYYRLVHDFPDTERFYAFNPQCILIAGNAKQELRNPEQKRSFELYRNSQGIQIVTYDEVFEKLDTLVNLLEGK